MNQDPMVEEFFSEVNDKYSPQVLEALEMLDKGEVQQGIEMLARPLHTIKGVTGFIPGFEAASSFTHKVEDFLKKIQSGEAAPSEENVALLSRGVNMIFTAVEQIRDTGAADQGELSEILALLAGAAGPQNSCESGPTDLFKTEERDGLLVMAILVQRVHLTGQREALAQALANAAPGQSVLIDLSGVLTFGSGAWETVAAQAESHDIAVCGMSYDCRSTFYSWGIDRSVKAYATARDHPALAGTGEAQGARP